MALGPFDQLFIYAEQFNFVYFRHFATSNGRLDVFAGLTNSFYCFLLSNLSRYKENNINSERRHFIKAQKLIKL